MKRIFLMCFIALLSAGSLSAQTKSFADAQKQMSLFASAESFSLVYDEAKYLTVADLRVDILGKKNPIRKRLKRFEWQLTTYFSIKGIEAKPARVVFCVNSRSKRWEFLRNNEMTLIFDGGSILLGEPHRSTKFRKGKANERLCWEVDKQLVEEFAAASGVAFAIGAFRGSVSQGKMGLFRDYGKLVSLPEK